MITGVTDGKIGLVWYWVEDSVHRSLPDRQVRKTWCRDNFGIRWQNGYNKWYFVNEKDRMLFILTWM